MAAGLGFKDFVTGEVLTAADVDGYLMQGVWVFASAAARDAAVTSPQEGNFAYLKDTNVTTYYTGSAWANLDTTGMTNPMTTTGDTIYSSSGSTPARLGIGSTGQVLTVAGGIPSWATPASGGGMTLINTGGTTFSGASATVSSIPGTYKALEIFIVNARPANDNVTATVRFNGSSTTNTYFNAEGAQLEGTANAFNANAVNLCYGADNGTQASLINISIPDYANTTTWKYAEISSIFQDATTSTSVNILWAIGARNNTEAISSLEFLWSSGNGTSGTIYVYGVN